MSTRGCHANEEVLRETVCGRKAESIDERHSGGPGRARGYHESSTMIPAKSANVTEQVQDYWDAHTLGLQFVKDGTLEVGTRGFFNHILPWMGPTRFPWLMERIERESALLKDRHLLELGCGMGFVSAEFIRRGVRVTATDLTSNAIAVTNRHFELEGITAETVETANALDLYYEDETFDAVWANGVLHHTGDTQKALDEVHRVLKPGGRAIISHFYRRPSWMYTLHRVARENIEFERKDPPVTDFYTEREILNMFDKYEIVEAVQDHYRMLPIARKGFKASVYTGFVRPLYNLIPAPIAKKYAYKFSVTAIKK